MTDEELDRYAAVVSFIILFNFNRLGIDEDPLAQFFRAKEVELVQAYIWRVLTGKDKNIKYPFEKNRIKAYLVKNEMDDFFTFQLETPKARELAKLLASHKLSGVFSAHDEIDEHIQEINTEFAKRVEAYIRMVNISCDRYSVIFTRVPDPWTFEEQYKELLTKKVLN